MNILFTGCCSGYGRTVKMHLELEGHYIFGVGLNGPDFKVNFEKASPDMIQVMADQIMLMGKNKKPFDALIYNAGMTVIRPLKDHSVADFDRVLSVNLTAAYAFNRAMLLVNSKSRIINVASMGIYTGLRHSPGYVASKAGLEALTRSLARETANTGAVLATLCPATIENTAMHEQVLDSLEKNRGMTREEAKKYTCPYPVGRVVSHSDLVSVIDYILFKMPDFCTGETFKMPGGSGAA